MSTVNLHICYLSVDMRTRHSGGGISSYLCSLTPALVADGCRVTIIALATKCSDNLVDGVRVIGVKSPNLHWFIYRLLPVGKSLNLPVREIEWSRRLWARLAAVHKEDPIDVVECDETALVWCRMIKGLPPIVVRGHGNTLAIERASGNRPRYGHRLTRHLEVMGIRNASAITAVSQFQARSLAQEVKPCSNEVAVIPNPIDPHFLNRALAYKAVINERSAPVVLYTGRIEVRKGTMVLLQSLAIVASQVPDVRYVIAGARHQSVSVSDLESALDGAGVRERVMLLGHIPWDELDVWYKRASVFAMPSLYETFGISVIEAMAFGLPVVATKAGGLPEVVEDGRTGILVAPGDPEALAHAILRLLNNPVLRLKMGQSGRKRVLEEFTVERVVKKTVGLYNRVATGQSDRA